MEVNFFLILHRIFKLGRAYILLNLNPHLRKWGPDWKIKLIPVVGCNCVHWVSREHPFPVFSRCIAAVSRVIWAPQKLFWSFTWLNSMVEFSYMLGSWKSSMPKKALSKLLENCQDYLRKNTSYYIEILYLLPRERRHI